MNRRRLLVAIVVWWLLGVLAITLRPDTRFLNLPLAGSLIISLADTTRDRLRRTAIVGLAFTLLWTVAHGGEAPSGLLSLSLLGAFLGLGALADLILHPPANPATTAAAFGIPAFALLPMLPISPPFPSEWTKDAVLLEADRALGSLFSYDVAGVLAHHAVWASTVLNAYRTLAIEVALVLLVAIRTDRPSMRPGRILLALLVAGLLGSAFYHLCPATGPRYAFSDFPRLPPERMPAAPIRVPDQFWRNAVPSLHFAWAWIVWRAAQPVLWLRWLTLAWLVGIAVGSLGFGEHYLIDLIVAFPFVTTIEAGIARSPVSRIIVGALVTLAWLIFLGANGHLTAPFAWPAVIASIMVGLWVAPRRPYAAALPQAVPA